MSQFNVEVDFDSKMYNVGRDECTFSVEKWGDYSSLIYYPIEKLELMEPTNKTVSPYPGIVIAHGYMCSKEDYSYLGEYLASQGYVCILFTTPSRINMFNAFPQSLDGISAAIDHLFEENRKGNGLLSGMIDEEKIGILGHSMGGITAFKAATMDDRIKVVVSLAPGHFQSFTKEYLEASETIEKPTQIILGENDNICSPDSAMKYYENIPSEREVIILNGTGHGLGIWSASHGSSFVSDFLNIIDNDPVKINYTKKFILSWFNYHLKNCMEYQQYIYGSEIWKDYKIGILSQFNYTRKYSIVVMDQNENPMNDVELSILNGNSTILWNSYTDEEGTANFTYNVSNDNYLKRLYLQAKKGEKIQKEPIDIIIEKEFTIIYDFKDNRYENNSSIHMNNSSKSNETDGTYQKQKTQMDYRNYLGIGILVTIIVSYIIHYLRK